jgi:hypothetical protein
VLYFADNLRVRFPVAAVTTVIDKVLQDELDKKEYDQDEAKEWSINISESIKAKVKGLCPKCKVDTP